MGAQTSGPQLVSYIAPSITDVSPVAFPTQGIVVTITGNNFGLANYSMPVTDNPPPQFGWVVFRDEQSTLVPKPLIYCVPLARGGVLLWSATSITCTLPPGVTSQMSIFVNITLQVATMTRLFSYGRPNITSLSPSTVQTQGACHEWPPLCECSAAVCLLPHMWAWAQRE